MRIISLIFKNRGSRVWFIVTASVLVFLLIVSMVATMQPFLRGTLDTVLGGPREKGRGDGMYYEADYENKVQTLEAANALNQRISEEGIILLKNDLMSDSKPALPIADGAKISVFGKNSAYLVYGGSGSSTSASGAGAGNSLYSSLETAGFSVNNVLRSFYEDDNRSGKPRAATPVMGTVLSGYPIGETPLTSYNEAIRNSYSEFSDAALVVLSRIGGEGYDLPRTMKRYNNSFTAAEAWDDTKNATVVGARSKEDHYLQLDQYEADLIQEAGANFDKVIIVINCSTPMELGFLDDSSHYAYHKNIKGALWIGTPGGTGINALGKILKGSVNPSGRTVDTYVRNFKNDPTWNNFGNNLTYMGNRYSLNGVHTTAANYYFVDYEEGIYVGYRYWETRAANPHSDDESDWYKKNVVYPFGYGKSYTDFDWEIIEWPAAESANLGPNDTITVKVKVTNTGALSGKDVVQLYYKAPYSSGGIEKSHIVLGDFAKTPELYPAVEANDNEKPNSAEVTLSLKVRDMASYDFNDANSNGVKGYELDGGRYTIYIGKDAHDAWTDSMHKRSFEITASTFDKDSYTGNEISNLFDNVNDYFKEGTEYKLLSRKDWKATWPTTPTDDEKNKDTSFFDALKYTVNDTPDDPWYAANAPVTGKKNNIMLYELIDKGYDDDMWNGLLDQLTVREMLDVIGQGNYKTVEITSIGKPRTTDPDGPAGYAIFMEAGGNLSTVYNTCFYASECVIAATWNKALVRDMGVMIGNESIIGNERGDGRPYSGWYAPAVNIHRSQFSGRNWEYYSEDGRLSGIMAANVVAGARSKGVYTYVKHFALNDQETNRDSNGILTWASEQSMREIYFKPFEMAVKDGGATAMMSSFNRIGKVWAGGNYALLTELLRKEWGFRGMVITDYNLDKAYMSPDQMIRAGGDINLTQAGFPSNSSTATQVACLRNAMKNILYTISKSNAMNGIGEGTNLQYALPYWIIALICLDCGVFAGLGVWGFFAIRKVYITKRKTER